MSELTRPVLRYHGGKWRLARWIISHFPAHHIYTEAYGGAASVLLQKQRSYAEVYNDLDGDVVNLFHILRDREQAAELTRLLRLTPFARAEFRLSYEPTDDPIEQARRLVMRSCMGFGSDGCRAERITGFRACSNRPGTTPAHDWAHYPDALAQIVERLQGVVIERRAAIDVIRQHDQPDTLHYVDPPYVHVTRTDEKRYRYEMTDADHAQLAGVLHQAKGMAIVSGYRCPLYDDLYAGWLRVDRKAFANGALARTESLWLSPAAEAHMIAPLLLADTGGPHV